MKKKEKIIFGISIICMVLVVLTGLTYAYWMINKKQTSENLIATSCLDVTITDESIAITQEKAYPLSDEKGLETTPYTFKLVNNCDIKTKVTMTLDIDKTENLSLDMYKTSLITEDKSWDPIKLSVLDPELNPDTVQYHKVVASDLLDPFQTKSYELRLWISKDVTITDVVGELKSQLRLSMEPYRLCGMNIIDTNPGEFKGTGTEEDPYLIESIEDLVALSIGTNNKTIDQEKKYILTTDLDFQCENSYVNWEDTKYGDINENGILEPLLRELTTEKGFMPIGSEFNQNISSFVPFTSNIDGRNHIIRNLYINRPERSSVGLIGYIKKVSDSNEYIKQLQLLDVDVTGKFNVGGLVGTSEKYEITYTSITTSGEVKSVEGYTGGVVGENYGSVYNSTNYANISFGLNDAGGIVGISYSSDSEIKNCKNYGNIVGTGSRIGGIVGTHWGILLENCENYGILDTKGGYAVGGIIGESYMAKGTIAFLTNYADITNTGSTTAGIMGKNDDDAYSIHDLYNYGNVIYTGESNSNTAGICAYLDDSTSKNYNLVNTGKITVYGGGYIGGIIGYGYSGDYFRNCINSGDIEVYEPAITSYSLDITVGGLSSMITKNIKDSYTTGNITVNSIKSYPYVGGVYGSNAKKSIKNYYSLSNITVNTKKPDIYSNFSRIGGIVGSSYGDISIENVYIKSALKGYSGTYMSCSFASNNSAILKNNYYNCKINTSIQKAKNVTPFNKSESENIYYKIIEGSSDVDITEGTTEYDFSVVNSNWFRDTLNLGNSWKYEDGYYPLLYRIDDDGNPIGELLQGQVKIAIE